MRTFLQSKIQEITVTACNVECEGSITLDANLIDKMGCSQYEQVYVNSKTGQGRIMTYLLAGERGSGCCELNGGAANFFTVGEVVHILSFQTVSFIPIKPKII